MYKPKETFSHFAEASILTFTAIAMHCLTDPTMHEAEKLGVSPEIVSATFGLVGHTLTHPIWEALQKTRSLYKGDLNSDLEHAIISAYENTFKKIESEICIRYKEEFNETKRQKLVRYFFRIENEEHLNLEVVRINFLLPLSKHLIDNDSIEEMLKENQQLNPESYLLKVIEKATPVFKETEDVFFTNFTKYVLDLFKKHFRHFFLQELKLNERAKTVYFTHLLESILDKVNIAYANQSEKLEEIHNTLEQFRTESNIYSPKIHAGLQEINRSLILLLKKLHRLPDIITEKMDDSIDRMADKLKEQLESMISKPNNIYIKEFIDKPIQLKIQDIAQKLDFNTVLAQWEKAVEDTNLPFLFIKYFESKFEEENVLIVEQLELAYNTVYSKTAVKSINSPFQKLSQIRASVFAKALLVKENITDKCAWEITNRSLVNMPTDGLADTFKEIHSSCLCTNKNKHLWASLIDWGLGNDSIANMNVDKFISLDNYSKVLITQNEDKTFEVNEREFEIVIQELQSSEIIKRVFAAFKISAWAWNLKHEPNNTTISYFKILDELDKMLLSNSLADRLSASYAFFRLIELPKKYYINGNRIRKYDQMLLVKTLTNNFNSPMIIQTISKSLGLIFHTEY